MHDFWEGELHVLGFCFSCLLLELGVRGGRRLGEIASIFVYILWRAVRERLFTIPTTICIHGLILYGFTARICICIKIYIFTVL